LQSAVSPISNWQSVRQFERTSSCRGAAEFNSAIRQITNLRYAPAVKRETLGISIHSHAPLPARSRLDRRKIPRSKLNTPMSNDTAIQAPSAMSVGIPSASHSPSIDAMFSGVNKLRRVQRAKNSPTHPQ
jgi:hypothetical protein